jgi:DNA-binding beta-propeller fold protein YncE
VGVTVSPDGEQIYVTESDGDRMIKIFDRAGTETGKFTTPGPQLGERAPVYLAMNASQRLFVSDRSQQAVFVYDANGNYLDSVLGPTTTLSKYLNQHTGGALPEGSTFYYNVFNRAVTLTQPGVNEPQSLPAPELSEWVPLGIRFNQNGDLFVTLSSDHTVAVIPAEALAPSSWKDFSPQIISFGGYGQEAGKMLYPNSAVADSRGRVYVTDGNNGRVSVWDPNGTYLFDFAKGAAEGALNLPRGAFIDQRDRFFVVDAVGQHVAVYDVSGDLPEFLYLFGDYGVDNGLFNYPNDIYVDATGRLYIADRENNRVQVWSY